MNDLYRIQVRGHLDDRWSDRFAPFILRRIDGGFTVLEGPVADQAMLHGLLAGVRDLGLTLVSVNLVTPRRLPGGN